MHDLNDLAYFVAVVTHGGFSAAARATGLEKTRLSRRIAALEQQLGVRLLQRNTRSIALTAAGERFFGQAEVLVEGARGAFESVAALRATPAGIVRLSCPQVMAQTMLLPILPGFLARYPKVKLELDANDRHVDLLNERFDLALRARAGIEDSAGLVAKELGTVRQVLVASPALLKRAGRPHTPRDLAERDTFARPSEVHDGKARWALEDADGTAASVEHDPRLVTNDLRMQVEAAEQGIGIALLPEPIVARSVAAGALEIVLPGWSGAYHVVHLLYPSPRGMLPSVRSLIDYLSAELPPAFGGQKT
ncbi:LysR family transcriptional regulator [Massilia sp. NEAU-DD11]|uniref:LysR family transcriptional regulator n=1 Tax=Massilia cellulosiltytica TaxID=2683234 RepID=A0A7X3KA28_9BURK|nr:MULTISPECIES: LysR substrate-binding domain-containing protein [Telluria group]KQZ35020.1 LysR family transcriptional regulator [Massilia sp. Root1485]MVW62960.1 LysR family transcriptional regulator [Telluria cellulosilytica]